MVAVEDLAVGVVFVLVAFLPSIVYAVWVRNLEKHGREPWRNVAKAFLWGAIGGVVLALALGYFLPVRPDAVAPGLRPEVFLAVVVAPVTEEFAKALGLLGLKDRRAEPEDGLVYGAAAGFGFAATENLLYEMSALAVGGVAGFLATAVLRTVSSALLHGSATALVGLGIWRVRAGLGGVGGVVGFYALAVLLHGLFNAAAGTAVLIGLVVSIALALLVFGWLRRHVRGLDRLSRPAEV